MMVQNIIPSTNYKIQLVAILLQGMGHRVPPPFRKNNNIRIEESELHLFTMPHRTPSGTVWHGRDSPW